VRNPFLPPTSLCFLPPSTLCLRVASLFFWGICRSQPLSVKVVQCHRARQLDKRHLGACLLLSHLHRLPLTFTFHRHTCQNARTVACLCSRSHTQITAGRMSRGQSTILRDGNEIAFDSPALGRRQRQSPLDDYRFIYRHISPVALTVVHAFYDTAHELGRGTFATVMKAMSYTTGEWWAVKIIHTETSRVEQQQR